MQYRMTMVFRTASVALIVLLISSCAAKQPFSNAKEINEQCMLEMEAARTAIRLRDKGKSRQDLAQSLPQLNKDSSRLLVFMHEILNEVFHYRQLNEVIYPTYRFELCSRQLTHKDYPYNIQKVYPDLLECQEKFGKKASSEGTHCIITSFQAN